MKPLMKQLMKRCPSESAREGHDHFLVERIRRSANSLGGPYTQMPTLKNFSNAVESAAESVVNLAERATGVDIDKDGDTGVNLTQP